MLTNIIKETVAEYNQNSWIFSSKIRVKTVCGESCTYGLGQA